MKGIGETSIGEQPLGKGWFGHVEKRDSGWRLSPQKIRHGKMVVVPRTLLLRNGN